MYNTDQYHNKQSKNKAISANKIIEGVSLWCLTPLSTTFQLYRGGQFYWWRKPEDPGKTKTENRIIIIEIYRFSFSCPWVTIFLHSRELNLKF
jgi:hypothetical protein